MLADVRPPALRQSIDEPRQILPPGEPVDIHVLAGELAQEEIHGPPTPQPHRSTQAVGDLKHLGHGGQLPTGQLLHTEMVPMAPARCAPTRSPTGIGLLPKRSPGATRSTRKSAHAATDRIAVSFALHNQPSARRRIGLADKIT